MDFINIDEDYDAYSKVLQELLARDIILLNAIIYDGKIYFAGHDDIDIYGHSDYKPIYDYVDENIAHMALPSSRWEHQERLGRGAVRIDSKPKIINIIACRSAKIDYWDPPVHRGDGTCEEGKEKVMKLMVLPYLSDREIW